MVELPKHVSIRNSPLWYADSGFAVEGWNVRTANLQLSGVFEPRHAGQDHVVNAMLCWAWDHK